MTNKETISEKKKAVYDLQNMLYVISVNSGNKDAVISDGIFGKETKDAVVRFQKENNLDPNGIVNSETWKAVSDKYKDSVELNSKALSADVFPRDKLTVIKRGDFQDSVYIIQLTFNRMSGEFKKYIFGDVNGILDETTEKNIISFQLANNLRPSGQVNKETWNKIVNYYNFFGK